MAPGTFYGVRTGLLTSEQKGVTFSSKSGSDCATRDNIQWVIELMVYLDTFLGQLPLKVDCH